MKGVDIVADLIAPWVQVKRVETGIKHGGLFIIVYFRKAAHFKSYFAEDKETARRIKEVKIKCEQRQ